MKKEEETFAIRTYDKAELASLYCPGREPGAALQNFYRWIPVSYTHLTLPTTSRV